MNFYAFDHMSGEYVGMRQAPIDPLETRAAGVTVYERPGRLETPDAPPAVGLNQVGVWAGAAWSIVADHRGETWWKPDGTAVEIATLGDPAEIGLLAAAPDLAPTAEDVWAEGHRRKRGMVGAVDDEAYRNIIESGNREAIRLLKVHAVSGVWTTDQASRADQLDTLEIALDTLDQITAALAVAPPADYENDRHWVI